MFTILPAYRGLTKGRVLEIEESYNGRGTSTKYLRKLLWFMRHNNVEVVPNSCGF